MGIEIRNLSHVYNPKTEIETVALNDVSFTFKDRFFTAIVGETGSGKTTLVQHLNGLIYPDKGEVKIDDYVLTSNKRKNKKVLLKIRKEVGFLFQFSEYQLFESEVIKDIMFAPLNFKYSEEEAKKLAIEALKKVGLNEDIYCKNPLDLSGGEKRRAALAGIIAAKPKYLILDEPTSGLDQKGKDDLYKLLLELYNDGINILIVTHDMDTVLKICDDVILMSNGSIVKHCDTLEFFKDKQIENYGIKIPKIFEFCNEFDKNFSDIRCLDDFIKELKNSAK